jgi:hypothetical protein
MDTPTATLYIKAFTTPDGKIAGFRVPAGQSILSAVESLQVDLRQPVIALVNGLNSELDYILLPGDEVRLIQQIAGG